MLTLLKHNSDDLVEPKVPSYYFPGILLYYDLVASLDVQSDVIKLLFLLLELVVSGYFVIHEKQFQYVWILYSR